VTSAGLLCDPRKLRFENSTNRKTLKQAWRFSLLYYLFVTQTFESSNFLESMKLVLDLIFDVKIKPKTL